MIFSKLKFQFQWEKNINNWLSAAYDLTSLFDININENFIRINDNVFNDNNNILTNDFFNYTLGDFSNISKNNNEKQQMMIESKYNWRLNLGRSIDDGMFSYFHHLILSNGEENNQNEDTYQYIFDFFNKWNYWKRAKNELFLNSNENNIFFNVTYSIKAYHS